MRDYGKVSPQFWIGKTGKALRQAGSEAQLVSLYLLTNPHANMIGLYYMPLMFIAHETGLGIEGASKGLRSAIEAGFCHYDEQSEMVWVPEMAAHQIGINLNPKDKRCPGVQNEYNAQPENPFLSAFYDKYQAHYNMTVRRGNAVQNASEFEGASKGLGSQEQEQEQEKEQEQNTMSDSNRTGGGNSLMAEQPTAQEDFGLESGESADSDGDGDGDQDPLSIAFEDIFWIAGLRKDSKVKARTAFRTKYRDWKKTTRGTPAEFAGMLADDIRLRVQGQQLGIDKLLPTSYLNGERWNDEKPASSPAAPGSATAGGSAGNSWFTQSNDGSAEVFVNQAAIERLKHGGYRS
ncbi:hypothetical protein [Enterobacter ludwigii]|uniref:hypothetical protein n=1 Tax=Enterobacter ludwigii TaxID=299767 RepID=UPI00069C4C94|nr:hypothetical protein [Enterobacter ludwigii]